MDAPSYEESFRELTDRAPERYVLIEYEDVGFLWLRRSLDGQSTESHDSEAFLDNL